MRSDAAAALPGRVDILSSLRASCGPGVSTVREANRFPAANASNTRGIAADLRGWIWRAPPAGFRTAGPARPITGGSTVG